MKEEKGLPVLIVDDHALVRQGIRSMLEGYAGLEVVGEASNGFEAIRLVEQLRPRVVLMDINMPSRAYETGRRSSADPEGRGRRTAL